MTHRIVQLDELGQSVWYDFITRDLVKSGELERLVRDEGLRGMTSNPTIFDKAIESSDDYDDDIQKLSRAGKSPDEIIEALMVADVRAAADVFRPVYDKHNHGDGTVSIEVPPGLAHDTQGTIDAAQRLWRLVARPNVMVKIPATPEGVPAIAACLAAGVNINITLLFSVQRYREVIAAFRQGLEQRVQQGLPIDKLDSVASFFVSRVDTQTDKKLAGAGDNAKPFVHQIAIANARVAYQVFGESLLTPWWQALRAKGARAQRPLWASMSTKDPSLPDTYYVDALVSSDTVSTIPPNTFEAFADHGSPNIAITPASEKAAAEMLKRLDKSGLAPLDDTTAFLEDEGVEKFIESWTKLVERVKDKAGALAA